MSGKVIAAALVSSQQARPSRSLFWVQRVHRMVGGLRPGKPGATPGGPGGPGGPPPGFGPGMFLAPQVLEFADANADGSLSVEEAAKAADKFIREADAEKKGSIDGTGLGRAINRRLGPPPGFGPGGPPGGDPGGPPGDGPGGPGGFGPGTFLGPRILEAADANKDGRLSPEEAGQAAERFVREADTKKRGSITKTPSATAINQRMGPAPGFGPGGPGGPMGQERKLVKQFDKDADGRLNQRGTTGGSRLDQERPPGRRPGRPARIRSSTRIRRRTGTQGHARSHVQLGRRSRHLRETALRSDRRAHALPGISGRRLGSRARRLLSLRRGAPGHADRRRQEISQRRRSFPRACLRS